MWILTPIIFVYVTVVMAYLLIKLPFNTAKWAFYRLLSLYDEDAYESYMLAHQHLKGQAHDVDEDGYDYAHSKDRQLTKIETSPAYIQTLGTTPWETVQSTYSTSCRSRATRISS